MSDSADTVVGFHLTCTVQHPYRLSKQAHELCVRGTVALSLKQAKQG